MIKNRAAEVERVRQLADHLFATTNNYHDLTLDHLAEISGRSGMVDS